MKIILIGVMLLLGMSSSLISNEIVIPEPHEGSDVIEVLIRGNGGHCSVTMSSIGNVEETDCIRLTNSKKIKILCTKNKDVCKTEQEVYDYLVVQLSSSNQDIEQSYTFNGIHQIEGTVQKLNQYGPPGYGENPKEDKLITTYILKLNEPIKVVEPNPNEMNFTTKTSEVQLIAFDFLQQLDIAEKEKKQVILNGEFFSAHTGYHIKDLLMDVKSMNLEKKSSTSISKSTATSLNDLRQGMKYSKARQIIMNSGLQAIRTRWQDIPEYGQDNDIYYNNGWQEVVSCAGTGTSPCRFEFQDINQKKLVVITEGECLTSNLKSPKKGEKCDVSVSQWFFEQPLTENSISDASKDNYIQTIKSQVLDVIENGSNRLGYPMGMMPPALLQGAQAEDVAEYIAGGMQGEQPASFASCSACHGTDGKGHNGMAPNLAEYANKRLSQNTAKTNKEDMTEEEACNAGDFKACDSVGLSYRYGMDGVQDYSKALKYYNKSCDGGYAKGCVSLATMYRLGDGVEKNNIKAKELFQKACDMGDSEGCNFVKLFEVEAKLLAEESAKKEKSWVDSLSEVVQTTYNKLTNKVPECSSKAVTEGLLELYSERREKSIKEASERLDFSTSMMFGAIPKSITRLEMIRATKYDESIQKRSCRANAIFQLKGKEITAEIDYSVQENEQNSGGYYIILNPNFIPSLSKKIIESSILGR